MKRLLAVSLMILLLSSCGGTISTGSPTPGDGEAGESPAATQTPEPTPEGVDLEGYNFHILDFADDRFFASAEQLGTPYGDAKMDVIEAIEAAYNCTITVENVGPDEVLNIVQPAVFSGDKYADVIITTEWSYGRLLSAGLMTDLSQISTLDLSNPWWIQPITEATTIGGKVLGTAGIFTHEPQTWVVYFNKRIWAELNLPDPYELVRNGEWTFTKMQEFCSAAAKDFDGNGLVDSTEDRFGLLTPRGDFERTMFLGMGGHYFSSDESGKLVVSCATPEAYDIAAYMKDFAQTPGVMWNGNDAIEQLMPMFADGKGLFLAYMVGGPDGMREMESDWGMLPTPKRSASQADYINVVDHNAPMFGITITNKDAEKAGIVLEALGKAFQSVNEIAREELETVFLRSSEDAEMMGFVENRGGYDLAFIMQQANSRFKTPMDLMFGYVFAGNASDYASDMESIKEVLQYECDTFLDPKE